DDSPPATPAISPPPAPEALVPPSAAVGKTPLVVDRLTAGFAARGIICAVLAPESAPPDPSADPAQVGLYATARRADLLVLDWRLGGSGGDRTLAIMDHIVRDDVRTGRTRLIGIYTDEPRLDLVETAVLAHLRIPTGLHQVAHGVLTSPQLDVVVLGKAGGVGGVPQDYQPCVIADDGEVAARLIDQFTALREGLLSNLAIAALGQLREGTHPLLARFDPCMDAAFVSDRSIRDYPAESEDLALSLVQQDIQTALDVVELRKYVNERSLKAWLRIPKHAAGFAFPGAQTSTPLTAPFVDSLIRLGRPNVDPSPPVPGWSKKNSKQSLTCVFEHTTDTHELDSRFAHLTHVQTSRASRREADPAPVLHLGTILARIADPGSGPLTKASKDDVAPNSHPVAAATHFLCVQPSCDSVRVTREMTFLFLPLTARTSTGVPDQFDIAVEYSEGRFLHLEVARKSFAVKGISFGPTKGGVVAARRRVLSGCREWVFESSEGTSRRFQWLADLRPFLAQSLLQEYSATLGRVGVDEGEWSRAHRKRSRDRP
ncbi:MAG: response regulator receiver domain, partial [Candidatus Korobacteraceae bacterium]